MFGLICGVCVVSRLEGRWAVYERGCGSVRWDAEFAVRKVSMHIRLLLATGQGNQIRSK